MFRSFDLHFVLRFINDCVRQNLVPSWPYFSASITTSEIESDLRYHYFPELNRRITFFGFRLLKTLEDLHVSSYR